MLFNKNTNQKITIDPSNYSIEFYTRKQFVKMLSVSDERNSKSCRFFVHHSIEFYGSANMSLMRVN